MHQPTTATGETFRAARVGAGLSVRALAARTDVSHGTISRWERGQRGISQPTYEHLTTALAEFMAARWAA